MAIYHIITIISVLLCKYGVSTDATKYDRIDALEDVIGKVIEENIELRNLVLQLKDDLELEKRQNKDVAQGLLEVKEGLSSRQCNTDTSDRVKRQGQLSTQWSAFSTVLQQTDLTNLQSGQGLIFDQVITNMGSSYDPATGIFTAPIRGLYVFNMDVMVEPSHNEYLEFAKDGSHVMYNYVHARGGLDDVSSSRTVVIELNVGDKFWVRVTQNVNHGSGTIHGNGFTTFSGYLLRIIE